MKNKIPALMLLLCGISVRAQTVPLRFAAVSETLKNNATVITYLDDTNLEVESLDKTTLSIHKVFTVMNEEGRKALFFTAYSTKYISLESAELRVYDATGKQVGKYKKKDMATQAIGEGLIEEGYVTYYRIQPPSYPVTVEIAYEQKIRSTLAIPPYRFVHAKEAVVASSYTVKAPAEMAIRYNARHTSLTPAVTNDGKFKTYKWSVTNLAAEQDEEGTVAEEDKFPYVSVVADQFSHYGYKGDLSTWKSFGAWINDLYNGLDELPADRQQFFQQLVSNASDDKEKTRRIYQYLQQNFRYVSIQLGIGGLQPFSATFTDAKKYGDCKALSNFMKAALKAVGIKSYVAIINAEYNAEPVDPGFPSNNFNHVILCVPGPTDSTWLECTSNITEFGKLGTFTENRNALLITENGGVLVPTPKSVAAANTCYTTSTVNLEADLSATSTTKLNTAGAYHGQLTDLLKQKKDDQKESLVFYFGFKQPDYFELAAVPASQQEAELKLELRKLPEFNAGTKYFINPRIHKMWSAKLPGADNRKLDFYFRFPFENVDTTIIKLPAGFTPDVLPTEKNLTNTYASYQTRYWYNKTEHAVYTATTFILKKHKVPATDYRMVKAFFNDVVLDDAQRIVVIKTTDNTPETKAF